MMNWRGLGSLGGRTIRKAWQDRVLGLSAEAAFWQLLSLPSLLLAILATLGYFAQWVGDSAANRVQANLLSILSDAFSDEVVNQLIAPSVTQVLATGRADVISVGFALALWAGSSATATFVNTITIAYGMRDLRGAVHSRLLALGLFLASIVVGAVVLPALILGPRQLARLFPSQSRAGAERVISDSYWPVVVLILLAGLTSLYHLSPPRRLPWRRGFPGAVLAMLVFVAGSFALRRYVSFVVAKNHAYGTLAAPIAALLFFYALALGVLLGAEFNAAIEATWPAAHTRDAAAQPRGRIRLNRRTGGSTPAPRRYEDQSPEGSDS